MMVVVITLLHRCGVGFGMLLEVRGSLKVVVAPWVFAAGARFLQEQNRDRLCRSLLQRASRPALPVAPTTSPG